MINNPPWRLLIAILAIMLSCHAQGFAGTRHVPLAYPNGNVDLYFAANRCASLKSKGVLSADTLEAQADEALARLGDYGWEPESAVLYASLAAFEVASAVSVTYANALARASVADALCGYSFAAAPAPAFVVAPLDAPSLAAMAATGNGVPPSSNVQLVNNASAFAVLRDLVSFSPSTLTQDLNLDGALCLRGLLGGSDAKALALQRGVAETLRSGNLQRKQLANPDRNHHSFRRCGADRAGGVRLHPAAQHRLYDRGSADDPDTAGRDSHHRGLRHP